LDTQGNFTKQAARYIRSIRNFLPRGSEKIVDFIQGLEL